MSDNLPIKDRPRGPQFHAEQSAGGERRPLRSYSKQKRFRRSVDVQQSASWLMSGAYSILGFVLGSLLGVYAKMAYGATYPDWMIPVFGFIAAAVTFFGPHVLVGLAGRFTTRVLLPSAGSTPHDKEYSYEESLVARGMYEEAATAFEVAVKENPMDPTPYLRLARVLRDNLERYPDAARWFRRVLRDTEISGGHAFLARKELVELYWHKMGEPTKAAPDLARMAEELEGTHEGEWAADELKQVKEIIAQEQDFG